MRRSLFAVSAIITFGILSVVTIGILVNNMRQQRPITAQTQPTATATSQPLATACGGLEYAMSGLMTGTFAAQQAAACFARAVSACHAAILNVSVMSVDTGVAEYSFSVSSACKVTFALKRQTTVTSQTAAVVVTCQRFTATADALEFTGCETHHDILLPTTHGAPWSNG